MTQAAITVRQLRKDFGEKTAVAGIDLEIAAGSFAGLVGPNSAGKTTSLSMMTGLLRPDVGQITVAGVDVWADPPAAKAVIGVVRPRSGCSSGSAAGNCWSTAGCAASRPPRPAPGRPSCWRCST